MVEQANMDAHSHLAQLSKASQGEDNLLALGIFRVEGPARPFPRNAQRDGLHIEILHHKRAVGRRHLLNPVLQQIASFLLPLQAAYPIVLPIDGTEPTARSILSPVIRFT